nr:hypothetical protein [Tanacetum cinerariifolium]
MMDVAFDSVGKDNDGLLYGLDGRIHVAFNGGNNSFGADLEFTQEIKFEKDFVLEDLKSFFGSVVEEDSFGPVTPTTAKQRLAMKNELKARGTLLMALPDKHQLKFNIHKDVKTLMEAVEKSTNEPVSVVASVSAASAKILVYALPNVDTLSNVVIYSFFSSQSNSPQGQEGILEQMDLPQWGFDMSKVECYNCHMKGHFTKECRSSKDTRRNVQVEPQRRSVPVETSTSKDGVASYDWSFQ